jgi:hypothetical protein
MAAFSEHADRERMVLRNDSLSVQCREERNLETFDEASDFRSGAASDRAEADQGNNWPVLS